MERKVFLASLSKATEKYLMAACESRGCLLRLMESENSLFEEIAGFRPDVIFIQALVMENSNQDILARLRDCDCLGKTFIVVFFSNKDRKDEVTRFNPDVVLSFPFTEEQIEAVFRIASGSEKLVLLMCLDEQIRLMVALEKAGLKTERATSVHAGLKRAAEILPDLIICCSRTLEMGIEEFCRSAKAAVHPRQIPLIILSENDGAENIEALFECGASDVIVPPFNDQANVEKIIEMVRPSVNEHQFNVLVIDDSPAIRSHISRMLSSSGFHVFAAGNGLEAIGVLDSVIPDLITCDYEMPVMDGWSFCKCVKGNPKYSNIPVIMITSKGEDIDRAKGRWLGIDAYLVKPFDAAELKRVAISLLKRSMNDRTMKVLEKYVSSDAVTSAACLSTEETSRAVEKEIVIMFCDICGFTTLCETMTTLEIQNMINTFYDKMAEILYDNHGIIDKFIGDAIVTRFDSGGRAVDAFNAANAALEMIGRMKSLTNDFGRDIAIRIGVNFGNVILGKFGSERVRMDFTMIGDAVNTAQRIESAAPANGCLLAEQVCALIANRFECGPTFEISVKNKEAPVRVNQLLGWWS